MKIAHISLYPPKGEKHSNTGGVASYTKNLLPNMHLDSPHETYILCNKINNKTERYTEDNITVIRCFDKKYTFVRQLIEEIKRLKPDTIHIQQELSLFGSIYTAYLLQWLLFALRRQKTVITLHGVVSIKKINKEFIKENNSTLPVWAVKRAFPIIYKPITKLAKCVIVHEDYFKKILVEEYGVPSNKITVIHHGVEDFQATDKKTACKALSLDSNDDIVLFMGYQTGYKGLDLLIDGFAQYAKTNSKAYLIIGAGKHPKLLNDQKYLIDYQRLQDKASKLIAQGQYKWVGFIEEKATKNYYSAADVSVYPYTIAMSSSGPMSFAIGYEKPFLVSAAFEDIFGTINKTILFERNPALLNNKLNDFFNNKQRFNTITARLKKERLWSSVARQTFELYKELP